MKKMKLKIRCLWPKESKKVNKAIETLLEEGYAFHTYLTLEVGGLKKGFAISKDSSNG